VNDAKKRVKETNVADVKRRMDEGEKFVLVDVREESEWAQDICRERFISAKELSRGTLRSACRTRCKR